LQLELEKNLRIEGAVAIQDDLADGVCGSISKIQSAGIHFWILTGDKADTAEAIAVCLNNKFDYRELLD
jgi:P-type E1-E2 ATPase